MKKMDDIDAAFWMGVCAGVMAMLPLLWMFGR